jgi:Ulp1 family protease
MNQERILELIAETAALTLTPLKKQELKQNDTTTNNVTLDMTMGGVNKQMADESVISTKNDPDVIKIARCKFDINKTYIEVVAKFVANKGAAAADEVVIRNDEANYFVTRGSIERLRPGKWLNDEIINAYIRLINLRKSMKGYALNTFFYTMLENMKLN